VFASGLSTPPSRNFDLPEQNYLSPSVQGIGFFAFALATLLTVLSILFVVAYRKKGVIRQSQPEFLYVMLAGCLTMTMAIITFSFDEGDGWTDQMLDRACIAGPWLISLGYSSIYCALFSKLWRINKVLQFARRKVEVSFTLALSCL
jgi:gamma-aminobutyric acid type B receptor